METERWQQKKMGTESEVLGSSQINPQLPQKWGQVEIRPCLLLKQAGTGQDETGTGRRVAQEPPGDVTFTGAAPQAATSQEERISLLLTKNAACAQLRFLTMRSK